MLNLNYENEFNFITDIASISCPLLGKDYANNTRIDRIYEHTIYYDYNYYYYYSISKDDLITLSGLKVYQHLMLTFY